MSLTPINFNLARCLVTSIIIFICTIANSVAEQRGQVAIEGFTFENASPAFSANTGPRIKVHRAVSPYLKRGNFDPFIVVAQSDGYQVTYLDDQISMDILANTDVFIIANAYTKDYNNFATLEAPSVYKPDEINLIVEWVKEGGSLLILADHSPFAGGTIQLASAFGFTYMTGHAISRQSLRNLIKVHIDFKRTQGTLAEHAITNGSTGRQRIEHYFAFGGQAIIPPAEAQSLFTIPSGFDALLGFAPAREFDTAPRLDASGLSQGATLEVGKGRLVILGETGGFTAQIIDGKFKNGFDEPKADQNKEFVLATLRWLARFNEN